MRTLVYIAGPYAGDIPENVRRATVLGRFAASIGFTPIVPHVLGAAGIYGSPDDDADSRPVALECGEDMAYAVANSAGHFWAILRDDGSMSDGTALEFTAFMDAAFYGAEVVRRTWADWQATIDRGAL